MRNKIAYCAMFFAIFVMRGLAATDVAYVAFNGLDTHPCTRPAPCLTITHALGVVSVGGDVVIVGSGSYDTFTITKAVTVTAEPGVVATIDVPTSGTGITVNAAFTDDVTVKGLTLHGNGGGVGLQANTVGKLTVEDCNSRNFAYGLAFTPTTTSQLVVTGGVFEGSDTGLYIVANNSSAAVDRVSVIGGAGHTGIDGAASILTVTNSTISDDGGKGPNQGEGVQIDGGTVVLENDVISHYTSGVRNFSTVYISGCNITQNTQGVYDFSGATFSRGNNTIVGNASNVVGTLKSFSAQ